MSAEITREQRVANIRHWKFQADLMAGHGFTKSWRQTASGKPRAYEHSEGQWRISTARGGKWKLEQWTGRVYYPPGARVYGYKIWAVVPRLFDTPLAVALWFHLVVDSEGKIKEWVS